MVIHEDAMHRFKKIFSGYYFDDNKPEFPSLPFYDLGDLSDHLTNTISSCLEICKKKRWIYSLLGNYPYFEDFCSGHIHTSTEEKVDWFKLKKILYNSQPFIALLSANSPIYGGIYRASDSRLAFSTWSRFSDFYDNDPCHWLSLTSGEGGSTLECRIPSSSPLFQIMGVMAFIRLIVEDYSEEPFPIHNTSEIYERTVIFGSKAIVPVTFPDPRVFIRQRVMNVFLVDLWKLFYKENYSRFKEILSTMKPGLQSEILRFYEDVASGITVSDKILASWNSLKDKVDFMYLIEELSESYNYIPVFERLQNPRQTFIQRDDKISSVEELREMLESLEKNTKIYCDRFPTVTDVVGLLNKDRYILSKIISYVNANGKIGSGQITTKLRSALVEAKVLKESTNSGIYVPSDNFPVLLQMLEGPTND